MEHGSSEVGTGFLPISPENIHDLCTCEEQKEHRILLVN
jgi:hypothetical protein